MKKLFGKALIVAASMFISTSVFADKYTIDTQGAHAFVEFKIKHLGYSWLSGRFNSFEGDFSFSQDNPSDATVNVVIDTTSVDTNHAERDKHLSSADFLNVSAFPTATFTGTSFNYAGDGKGTLTGDLTLHGVTKSIDIAVTHIGQGNDPWGGFRSGFEGKTTLTLADFDMNFDLGPASTTVELTVGVEGMRI